LTATKIRLSSAPMSKAQAATTTWEREQIARAISYVAYLFNGRFDKHRIECDTLDAALAAAANLNATAATNVRRAIVYAITPEGWSIQVSAENCQEAYGHA
jgi:hypothetical protein